MLVLKRWSFLARMQTERLEKSSFFFFPQRQRAFEKSIEALRHSDRFAEVVAVLGVNEFGPELGKGDKDIFVGIDTLNIGHQKVRLLNEHVEASTLGDEDLELLELQVSSSCE